MFGFLVAVFVVFTAGVVAAVVGGLPGIAFTVGVLTVAVVGGVAATFLKPRTRAV